jgi:cytidyltransferase-like protein
MLDKSVALITGGFDPIHSGHLAMIASADAQYVIVGVNSDEWLVRKKGNYFQSLEERIAILKQIKGVDAVITFNDTDDSACDAITFAKEMHPNSIIRFLNGGDRTKGNILEAIRFADDPQVEFVFGVGGTNKMNSSSDMLNRWKEAERQVTTRSWGSYEILHEIPGLKVKQLTVLPQRSISLQKHEHRAENWFFVKGTGLVKYQHNASAEMGEHKPALGDTFTIKENCWHQLINESATEPLHIVEIQYGKECKETDIVRQTDK